MPDPLLLPIALPPAPAEHPDVAYTDPAVARAHVEYLGRRYCLGTKPLTMWEPFVGGGVYPNAWKRCRPWDIVVAGDLDPGAPAVRSGRYPLADVFDGPPVERPQWVVSNGPFSTFDQWLPVLLEHAEVGVSLLMVGQSLAPAGNRKDKTARDRMWTNSPPDEMCWLTPRLSFDRTGKPKGGTDMREYALVTWYRRAGTWRGRMRLSRLNWRTSQFWGRG